MNEPTTSVELSRCRPGMWGGRVLVSAAVLAAAGSGLGLVIKTTVYLMDMADFPAMNEVYARHFGSHKPARSTIQAATLPKGARIEIDALARVG